jgi:hypothetical protein
MDDYEIDAFILLMELHKAQRTFPRSEHRENNFKRMIIQKRKQSRTWRPLNKDRSVTIEHEEEQLFYKAKPRANPIRVVETGERFWSIGRCAKAMSMSEGRIKNSLATNTPLRGYTFELTEKFND